MKKNSAFVILSVLLGFGLIAGCEMSTNPLIFDGSVTSGEVAINTNTNTFLGIDSLDLHAIVAKVSQSVDSVKLFNLTIAIDSLGSSTPASTRITGAITVDDVNVLPYHYNIVTLTGVPLSEFASERSIFDTTISGFSFNESGSEFLIDALAQSPPPVLYVNVQGSADHNPVQFRLRFKVYAQVYTAGS